MFASNGSVNGPSRSSDRMGKPLCRNSKHARSRRRLTLLNAHLTKEATCRLAQNLKEYFSTPVRERNLRDLAPETINLHESDAKLVRASSPLHIGRRCTVWPYTLIGESGARFSERENGFALKVVTKNDFGHAFVGEEASFDSRRSMRESVVREVRSFCCDDRFVVENTQLSNDAEATSPLGRATSREHASILEVEARHAVTSVAHRLIWGAQLMVAADIDAGRFVRNLGASFEYRELELVQLARLTLVAMLRLKRFFKMYQVDFKWENCGLCVESRDRVSVKLLDTSGVISELDATERMTTYSVRSDRHRSADETMVVWGFGIALCQLANPHRYGPISKYFKQIADGESLTPQSVRCAVCPLRHETSEWFFAIAIRCFGLTTNRHLPTLRTLIATVDRHKSRRLDRTNAEILASLRSMREVSEKSEF
ncbi:hypothetical protein CYMTET_39473 [Cymbomonas tetramitiformis]|uniref:Protein kinase domain-containing protein n=1 Tax=Cymbomonas tetramitiformis TaxID=36881 RepID=A0AAE0CBP0_9CHLO|nr:hypothetical protein CYMTET_39473 [Cymbomonas tetramitiformis]